MPITTEWVAQLPFGVDADTVNVWNPDVIDAINEAIAAQHPDSASIPGAGDDYNDGYRAGRSIVQYIGTSPPTPYLCVVDTPGAAVWVKFGGAITISDLPSNIPATLIADGSVSDTEFQRINTLTSNAQDQLDQHTTDIAALEAGKVDSPITVGDLPTAIPATNIGAGTVDNTEFGYLNGVTSAIQTQINARALLSHRLTHVSGGSDQFQDGDILRATARTNYLLSGVQIGTRREFNLAPVNTSTVQITVIGIDDAVNDRVTYQVSIAGGGVGTDELAKVGATGTPDYLSNVDFTLSNHIRLASRYQSNQGDIDIWVSDAGSDDTGDGTQTNPYATVPYVWNSIVPANISANTTVTIRLTGATFDAGNVGWSLRDKGGNGVIVINGDNPTVINNLQYLWFTDVYCYVNVDAITVTRPAGSTTSNAISVAACPKEISFGNNFRVDNSSGPSTNNCFSVTSHSNVLIGGSGGGAIANFSYFISASGFSNVNVQSETYTGNLSAYVFSATGFSRIIRNTTTALTGTSGLETTSVGGTIVNA